MSRRKQKNHEKGRKNNPSLKVLKILIVVFLFALLVLVIIDLGVVQSVQKLVTKPKPIVIQGECYAFMNTVIYQINSDADCQKFCSDRCWVDKENYKSSQFVLTPGSCNLCDCYCG